MKYLISVTQIPDEDSCCEGWQQDIMLMFEGNPSEEEKFILYKKLNTKLTACLDEYYHRKGCKP